MFILILLRVKRVHKQKAFIISAGSEAYRWETLQAQLKHLNIEKERVEAVMGHQLTTDEYLK
jgi:competence protein ComGC